MAATYKIVSQSPSTELTRAGEFIDTIEITFETIPHRTVGIIRVPTVDYTEDTVARLVGEQAAVMIAVQEL